MRTRILAGRYFQKTAWTLLFEKLIKIGLKHASAIKKNPRQINDGGPSKKDSLLKIKKEK